MKKLLLFAMMASAVFAGSATLPQRTVGVGRQMKALSSESVRVAQRQAVRRAADADSETGIAVPFTHTLGKNTEVTDYLVIDANNDTRTWKPGGFNSYSVCMPPNSGDVAAADDWLISPAVYLEAGKEYTVSYEEDMTLSKTEDKLGLYAGTVRSVEGMTLTVIAEHAFPYNNKVFTKREAQFSVDETGNYYFGFHCTSERVNSGTPKICNFSIKQSTPDIIPAAAGSIEVTPAPLGELKATVKYTAPTVNAKGEPLTQLSKVIVTTNWAFKTELTDVVPGGEYTFETTDVYNNGYNRFEAVAYIGDVAGEAALLTDQYFGMDNPQPVTGVKAVLSDDFKTVTLSWEPVGEVGEKGGYVDTSKVVYYVFDAFGSYYDPALTTTSETSVSFDYSDAVEQDFVAYQVTAGIDETYYSLETNSNIVVIGQPEMLPFSESYADGYYSQMWVVDPESQGQVMNGTVYDNELQTNSDADEGVEPEYLNSQDADNGFFLFMPIDINSSYGFYSTKISLEGAENPVFEFWYQGKGSVLDAKLGVDGGELTAIHSIDLKENPTDDWTLARIDLTPYKSAKYVQIGVMLRAIHNTDENIWSVPFDNLRVIDLQDEALRVSVANIPAEVKAGEEIPVSMTIENIGRNELTAAQIAVSVDGVELEPIAIEALAPGKLCTAKASVPTSVLSNDIVSIVASAKTDAQTVAAVVEKDVAVKFSALPMPTDIGLIMTSDGYWHCIMLDWKDPEYENLTKPTEVFEDFENEAYEPFTYSDFAGFQFVDLDGEENYTFLKDTQNPYRCEPMAYQLFSPELAGVPEEYLADCPTHSGKSMLVAWSCDNQNANLLISPELTGEEQTVSFWGRGFTVASGMHETFSVWVSDTDTQVKSFTQLHEVENYPESGVVPEEWTEFKVTVPAGTKYFAILHDSYDSYALFLDDFSFQAAGILPADTELTGYNVYCNGALLPDMPVDYHGVIHDPEENGLYSYRISALYNNGESRATEPFEVDFHRTSIVEIAADGVTMECLNGVLTVSAPEGMPISVIDLAGRVVASSATRLTATVSGQSVVLVTVGTKAYKVAVN